MAQRHSIALTVNGKAYTRDVEPRQNLVDFLRDDLALPGTHVGCEQGVCGACTVHLDGRTVRACLLFAVQADGAAILTVEGLAAVPVPVRSAPAAAPAEPAAGEGRPALHPIQQAFWDHHGLQCGFCTPGMLLTALELLTERPDPTEAEIREGLAGNLCMCTGYVNVVKAVRSAARVLRGEPPLPPGPEPGH